MANWRYDGGRAQKYRWIKSSVPVLSADSLLNGLHNLCQSIILNASLEKPQSPFLKVNRIAEGCHKTCGCSLSFPMLEKMGMIQHIQSKAKPRGELKYEAVADFSVLPM